MRTGVVMVFGGDMVPKWYQDVQEELGHDLFHPMDLPKRDGQMFIGYSEDGRKYTCHMVGAPDGLVLAGMPDGIPLFAWRHFPMNKICGTCMNQFGEHKNDGSCPERDDLLPQRVVGYSEMDTFMPHRNSLLSKRPDGLWVLDLTSGERTPLGIVVYQLYYKSNVLDLIQNCGCPHNGGEHTLSLIACKDDLIAFMDIVIERYRKVRSVIEILRSIRVQVAKL